MSQYVHAQSAARHVKLALPMIDLQGLVACASEKVGIRLLALTNIEDLALSIFRHLPASNNYW